jgi:hypothetical protein
MFQFPGFALIPLWIQRISNSKSNQLPVTSHQSRPWSLFTDNWSLELGFPIRKFPDQSLFAAPRNLSQRTTSFIASQRQGIRRIPFRHLIVARNQKTEDGKQKTEELISRQPSFVVYRLIRIRSENAMQKTKNRSYSLPYSVFRHLFSDQKRPVLLQTHPGSLRSGSDHDWYARTRMTEDGKQKTEKVSLLRRCLKSQSSGKPDALPLHNVKLSEDGERKTENG